jgi:hypothetical protein
MIAFGSVSAGSRQFQTLSCALDGSSYTIIECGITVEEVSLASNSVAVEISFSKLADIGLEVLLVLVFS